MNGRLIWLLSLALAHAFAITLVSHSVLVIQPPSRLEWMAAELLLAGALWWPLNGFLRRIVGRALTKLPHGQRTALIALSLALGGLTAAWWRNDFPDGLWVHSERVAKALGGLLVASHAIIAATLFAGLLSLTVHLCHFNGVNDDANTIVPQRNGFSKGSVCTFLFIMILANIFAIGFVSRERAIYYWDYSTYWNITSDWERAIHDQSPLELWDRYRLNLQNDDYGPLPATLPSLIAAVFGPSRLVYILGIVNLYFAAVALLAWRFVLRFGSASNAVTYVVPFLAVLLCPLVWIPLLRGYLDLGGVAIGIAILIVAFGRSPGKLRWFDLFTVGALLAAIVLFRRWYSYYAVAFFLLAGLDATIAATRTIRSEGAAKAAGRIGSTICVGVWMAVLLGTFATPWLWRIFNVKYANDYIAYQNQMPLWERIGIVIDNCGLLNGCIVLISWISLLVQPCTRRIAVILGIMPPIMLYLFLKVADLGMHHCYLLLPAYLLLPSLALVQWNVSRPRWIFHGLIVAYLGWNALSMMSLFVPRAYPVYESLRPAICHFPCPPLVQDNLDEVIRLLRETEHAASQTRHGRTIVVASSTEINQTMFITANRSLNQPLFNADRLSIISELDRVSSFPRAVFESDIAVVPWPPQTHLREEEQQLIVLTARALHEGTGIGRAFERLPGEFHLGEAITVSLYRRVKPIEPADLNDYADQLRRAHPEKKALFTPPEGFDANPP